MRHHLLYRCAILSASVLVGLAGVAALPGLGNATPSPVPAPPTFSATHAPSATSGSGALAPAAGGIMVCNLKVDNVHHSNHVGGTVNVQGTTTCNPAASALTIQITLYKEICDPNCTQVPYGNVGSKTNVGQRTITANSAAACTSGTYFGVGTGTVVSPPGYLPAFGPVSDIGPQATISC
jgi:hypothetical protein